MALLPIGLALALLASNSWFTEVDDECAIIDHAARPAANTVQLFLSGAGMHEHPPLYDLFLHGWLRLTGGNIHLLRLPSVLFYVVGAWVLSIAAKRLGGEQAQFWTLLLVVLSPFGFHFGRLATWYSCAFLLVSLVTCTYLRFLQATHFLTWIGIALSALALVYANYFGWVLLGLLAFDYLIHRRAEIARAARWPLLTVSVLLVAYLPVFRAFIRELRVGTRPRFIPLGLVYNFGYNIYLVFVSESVAPWFWFFSIVSCLAIAVSLVLVLRYPTSARRFLLYFLLVIACLTALGIITSKRTFFLTPWLFLPLGVALGTIHQQLARRVLLFALALCAAVGWVGIFARNMYVAPHWMEPWNSVARESADVVRSGGIVIGNNPSFFFYLTYRLPVTSVAPHAGAFAGLLPDSVRAANVYTPQQWIDAGKPTQENILMTEGLHYGTSSDTTDATERWLNSRCLLQNIEKEVRDPGAEFKQRYVLFSQPEWRVQVRHYFCP